MRTSARRGSSPCADPFEAALLPRLLGPEGRHRFALAVARAPDRAPGGDGFVNNVWRHLPAILLDGLWDYFVLCIRRQDIHATLVEAVVVLLCKGT